MQEELKNIIRHRGLLLSLAVKDIKVQYRRPLFGFLWSFFLPLFTVLIFQVVFSFILRVPVDRYPFFIYLMTALFPWRFFQASISRATSSIVDNRHLLDEASFPRKLIPLSVVLAELINFIPSLAVIIIFLFCLKIIPPLYIIFLPLFIFIHVFFTAGISLIVSSLEVKTRDMRYIVELALTALFYLSPVFYPLSMVTDHFKEPFLSIYLANPLVGFLNLYRAALLPGFIETLPDKVTLWNTFIGPLAWTIFFVALGFFMFSKREKTFSDYLFM